jgi:hypothetical protein
MKFRVLSDLHIDYNDRYPINIDGNDQDIFTILCGDTSGDPRITIDWIKNNIKSGVFISGNHLPYCNVYDKPISEKQTMSELRQILSNEFPIENNITYFDVETGVFKKVINNIIFLGSCCYTDMRIKHEYWNPNGEPEINYMCSEYNMNDYRYGYISREWPLGMDNEPKLNRITASDYEKWFTNAIAAFDKVLNENESLDNPLPVVLFTHHPLLSIFLNHSYYVDNANYLRSRREFNWASYASDYENWLKSHNSIKCYCCGHIHAVEKPYRHFKLNYGNNHEILVINNARGYVPYGHDTNFNINLIVDSDTWSIDEKISLKTENLKC